MFVITAHENLRHISSDWPQLTYLVCMVIIDHNFITLVVLVAGSHYCMATGLLEEVNTVAA